MKLVITILKIYFILIAFDKYNCQLFDFDLKNFFIETGTVWCGSGNKAENCSDLGEFIETDKCCREHDMCPYTFSKDSTSYNGFKLKELFTLSHCECDLIFRDCLHEKPYKENSFTIWSRWELLKLKCFAYLPCNENESSDTEYKNIISNAYERQTGSCENGAQVFVFDSIDDYSYYMKTVLNKNQILKVKELLENEQSRFISFHKKNFMCFKDFLNYPQKIIENFIQSFFFKSTTDRTTSQITSHLNHVNIASEFNKTKLDKKISSAKKSIWYDIKEKNPETSNGFPIKSFLIHFFIPVGFVLIVFFIYLIAQTFFENQNEYRYENP